MSKQPRSSLPQCCGDAAQTKAAYRFFDHEELDFAGLLEGHEQASWQRIGQSQGPVLVLEDSTAISLEGRPATEGLGPIGARAEGAQGLWLHSALAVSPDGCTLGLVHAQCWVRDAAQAGQRHRRHQRALPQKESYRWVHSLRRMALQAVHWAPKVPLIRVTDREGDLWAVLVEAQQCLQAGEAFHVLTRSRHDRQVQSPSQSQGTTAPANSSSLWSVLSQSGPGTVQSLSVPAHSARKGKTASQAREAELQVRFCPVRVLAATQSTQDDPQSVDCWAVEAVESQPPVGSEPLHWRLLTTWPVKDSASAQQVLRWYALRWQIEVMHKVLKSGLGIEQRALRTEARLEAVLALSLIVAWRIMSLRHLGRQQPQKPAAEVLEPDECLLLQLNRQNSRRAADHPAELTIQQATEELARLGGWLGRKRDEPPGVVVLWRGMQTLAAQIHGFHLAQKLMGNR